MQRKLENPMYLPGEPEQPIPNVTEADVVRITRRDYPASVYNVIMRQLSPVDDPRIKLAVLKLANGKVDLIQGLVEGAMEDYRNVLASAEYPKCMSDWDLFKKPPEVRQAVYDEDWSHYLKWLDG